MAIWKEEQHSDWGNVAGNAALGTRHSSESAAQALVTSVDLSLWDPAGGCQPWDTVE